MKIIFHSNQLGVRGTEVALFDYAFYNREILGNDSIIVSDRAADLSAYEKFKSEFDVILYDNFNEVIKLVDDRKVDAVYYQKAGQYDGKIVPNAKNFVHSVFQFKQPHGDVYAYISKWLSNKMGGDMPYVPYMVDILKHDHSMNYREYLNIPKDATVFGYYGGPQSFNLEFAKNAVIDVATKNKNVYFIFMNSDVFCTGLDNVLFLQSSISIEDKIGFINTCDACIHARNGGESFGLTVAEFSIKNKPVITTSVCQSGILCDAAHIELLGEKAILYDNYTDLVDIFNNFKDMYDLNADWNAYREYSPALVMNQFKKVFIDNI
jgi:hypothetical protein